MSRIIATVLASGVAATLLVPAASAQAAVPQMSGVYATSAPKGGKGGITTYYLYCDDGSQPNVRVTLTKKATGWSRTYSKSRGETTDWTIARVTPGTYKVRLKATCGGTSATRNQTVTVDKKTDKGTISPAEYRRVRTGMTLAQVTKIVGSRGLEDSMYGGKATRRVYPSTRYNEYTYVTYRKGRVISKVWNAPVGDRF